MDGRFQKRPCMEAGLGDKCSVRKAGPKLSLHVGHHKTKGTGTPNTPRFGCDQF